MACLGEKAHVSACVANCGTNFWLPHGASHSVSMKKGFDEIVYSFLIGTRFELLQESCHQMACVKWLVTVKVYTCRATRIILYAVDGLSVGAYSENKCLRIV